MCVLDLRQLRTFWYFFKILEERGFAVAENMHELCLVQDLGNRKPFADLNDNSSGF